MTPTLRPTARSLTVRRATTLAVTLVMAVSLVGAWGSDHAEATSYRFWSYWVGGSSWTFSSQGASRRPPDGGVEGWRFAISPATSSTIPPRHSPSFNRLCSGTPAQEGQKRVGLVIDSGTAGDAPDGESPPSMITSCAVVPEDANGYEVLMTVAQLRTDGGLICGINGYPATECGAPVSDPSTSPSGQPGGGSGRDGGGTNGEKGTGTSGGADTANDGQQGGGASPSAGTGGHADKKSPSHNGKNNTDDPKKRERGKISSASPSPQATDDATSAAAAATTTPGSPGSGSPIGVIIGLVVLVGLGAGALFFARRRA